MLPINNLGRRASGGLASSTERISFYEQEAMLTVRATLQPNGQVQLPLSLARGTPVPVLVTILESLPEARQTLRNDWNDT